MNVPIPCICPARPDGEQRHPDGDTVALRDVLDFRTTTVLRQSVKWLKTEDPEATVPEVLAMLTEAYLVHCIESWTVVDAKGKAVGPSHQAIRDLLLPTDSAAIVGDVADSLYSERVLLPLLAQGSTSSPPSSTSDSTSATTGSGQKPLKPSKPSSTTSSPTAGTAPIPRSPDGDFSSSPSSASAG